MTSMVAVAMPRRKLRDTSVASAALAQAPVVAKRLGKNCQVPPSLWAVPWLHLVTISIAEEILSHISRHSHHF